MIKQYKSFGVASAIVGILILLLALIRPYIKITPAVHLEYKELVAYYARENRLDPALVFAVIKTESNFDSKARSKQNAIGLMQITESTLNWAMMREGRSEKYSAEDLYDPELNIRYGCIILSLLIEEFENTDTALAAYNAGRGNVIKWLKDSRYSDDGITIRTTPYSETNQYIKKVKKHQQKYTEMLGEEK